MIMTGKFTPMLRAVDATTILATESALLKLARNLSFLSIHVMLWNTTIRHSFDPSDGFETYASCPNLKRR